MLLNLIISDSEEILMGTECKENLYVWIKSSEIDKTL